jgi:DNA processing protein
MRGLTPLISASYSGAHIIGKAYEHGRLSSMPTKNQIALLSLCRIKRAAGGQIKHLSWYLVAREAMRPGGLDRLLQGRVTERSKEATEAKRLLDAGLPKFDESEGEVRELLRSALKEGVRLTTVLDADYPLNLRTIYNRPPFLFYRGELREDDAFSVAVVGTRLPSPLGVKRAGRMARQLAEKGVTVLSGLAKGIDTAAHRAALEAGGRTIAVLGSGIRKIYPRENEGLAEKIVAKGAVVSQFWPDGPPTTYTFPRRNITMSGLGQGTVVIEASATSGAKMQARLAIEHGKKVFLLDSLVKEHAWAQGYMEKRGARKVTKVEDILGQLRTPDEVRDSAEHAVPQKELALW